MNSALPKYKIYVDENVIHIVFFDQALIDLETAKEIELIIKRLTSAAKVSKLIDARATFTIEREAQGFFQSQRIKKKTLAQAILIGNQTKQITMDFFLDMASKKMPVKLFVDYDMAILWLRKSQTN